MADRYHRPFPDDAHAGQPARPAEGDPLAELARLIGQTDPFANFGREQQPRRAQPETYVHPDHAHFDDEAPHQADVPPPSWTRARESAGQHGGWRRSAPPDQGVEDEYAAYEAHQADVPSFLQSSHHAGAHDQSRYDDVFYGAPAESDPYQGSYAASADDGQDYDPEAYPPPYDGMDAEAPRERRGGMLAVIIVLVLGVAGTAGAFAYRSFVGGSAGSPPVIKADAGPNKIVPPKQASEPGGKLIYDRVGAAGAAGERVVPREEQPVDVRSAAIAQPRVVFPPLSPPNQPSQAAMAPPADSARAAPATTGGVGEEPKRIRTVSIRPDQPGQQGSGATQSPGSSAVSMPRTPATTNAPLALMPQSPGAAPQTRQAATTTETPEGVAGGYVVQISSQRSEADARASFRALQAKFPGVLAGQEPVIRRADLGTKGVYYRAMLGPYTSADEATRICGDLKSAGGQCVVQRN